MHEQLFYPLQTSMVSVEAFENEIIQLKESGDYDQAVLNEIKLHLTKGHEHYRAKRYGHALEEYLQARALIYSLLEPDTPTFPGVAEATPVDSGMFSHLLEEILSRIHRFIEVSPPIPDPIDPIDPSPELPITLLKGLGVTDPSPISGDPSGWIAQGIFLAREGHLAQAETQLKKALEALGEQPRVERAVALENLAVVTANLGDTGQANRLFEEAAEVYSKLEMTAEFGGVLENHAAMLTGTGEIDAALAQLNRAHNAFENAAASSKGVKAGTLENVKSLEISSWKGISLKGDSLQASLRIQEKMNQLSHIRSRDSFFGKIWLRFQRGIQAPSGPSAEMCYRDLAGPIGLLPESTLSPAKPGMSDNARIRFYAGTGPSNPGTFPPRVLEYRLSDKDTANRIIGDYFEHRINIKSLTELGWFDEAIRSPGRFEIDLCHYYFFTVHVCLAKCYMKLGRFEDALDSVRTARDYPYINMPIEVPFLWVQFAKIYIEWGHHLYKKDDRAAAREKYLKVVFVQLSEVRVDETSELYSAPVFSEVKSQVESLLAEIDGDTTIDISPDMEDVVRTAYQHLRMIEAGLNFFGIPESPVTIFRFKYLQAIARYFSEQAIKAEREYINFWTNAERETQSLMQLEQSVEVAEETVELEARRVEEVQAMIAAATAAVETAQQRLTNAQDRRNQYATLGRDIIALDTATAHASGGFTETEGGYDVYLHSTGGTVDLGDEDYIIMRNAARRRGEITYEMELAHMDRQIAELQKGLAEAQAQLEVMNKRLGVAEQGEKIAKTKKKHAEENLEYAQNKVFTPELWFNLAEALQEISNIYLERAIETAFLMEEAYNFEYDQTLSIIKADYANRDELAGLLAGNLLLADIDYFTYHHITQVKQKALPIKINWSVGQRSPFLLYEFRRTGQLYFETLVEDLDEMYPGTYLRKLQAVEIVLEGLIGADGFHGMLSNSGISLYRNRQNETKVRIQPKETMLVSAYDLRRDSVVFRPSEEIRGVFEDSGVATGWTFDIPVGTNDLNYESIRDIRIQFYFESFFDPLLAETVKGLLPSSGTWTRVYSMETEFPDSFFRFQDIGELAFDIRKGDFPYHHTDQMIESLSVMVLPEVGFGKEVTLRLKHPEDPDPDAFTTATDTGMFSSDPGNAGNPLNGFLNTSPMGDWLFLLDFDENPDFKYEDPQGIQPPRIVGIKDIVLSIVYTYQRRTPDA